MYRELGFVRVWGAAADGASGTRTGEAEYAYLIYPHRPIVAYIPQTGQLLGEYCVDVPRRDPPIRQRQAARLRRRTGEMDGADR